MKTLHGQLQKFAHDVEANLIGIQQEFTCTQGEVSRTQAGIQTLVDGVKNAGSSSPFRPSHERDR